MNIPPAYAPFVDALLRALDPRLSEEDRETAAMQAAAEPEFSLGMLVQTLREYHDRAEGMAGYPPGTFVDRLRQRAFGGRSPEEVLGYAVNSVSAGEELRFVLTDEAPPAQKPPARPLSGPPRAEVPRPLVEVALQAEAARRGRLEAELMGGATGQGGKYPGSPEQAQAEQVPADDGHPFPVEDFERNGVHVAQPGSPELAGLLARLNQQRAEESAVDSANPDDPRTMGPAIRAAADLAAEEQQARPAATPVSGRPVMRTYAPVAPRPPSDDGNNTPCGFDTGRGPCALTAGHPELPVPGTVNGHMSEEMAR